MSVMTETRVRGYASGGYTNTTNGTLAGLGDCIIPKQDVMRWAEMSDAEREQWMEEAKSHSHCACGNPRFHLVVIC